MDNLLEANHLFKHYSQFDLSDVSFELPAGVIMGFIGENGAGKTTTIKLILDLIKKDSGEIRLLGKDLAQLPPELWEQISVVFDNSNIPEIFTLEDVSTIMSSLYNNWDQPTFDHFVSQFGLPNKTKVKTYSRGMKLKLMLAVAFSHHPRLIILDEATSGLDPVVRDEILEYLQHFVADEGHSVFISSHILSDLEKICDYILFIHKGRVRFLEGKDTLREKYGIWKGSQSQFAELQSEALVGHQSNPWGVQALVERAKMPANATLEPASIEDIMLYIIKEGTV